MFLISNLLTNLQVHTMPWQTPDCRLIIYVWDRCKTCVGPESRHSQKHSKSPETRPKKDDKSGDIKTNAHRRVGMDDMHLPGQVTKVFHNQHRQLRRQLLKVAAKNEIREKNACTHARQEQRSPDTEDRVPAKALLIRVTFFLCVPGNLLHLLHGSHAGRTHLPALCPVASPDHCLGLFGNDFIYLR